MRDGDKYGGPGPSPFFICPMHTNAEKILLLLKVVGYVGCDSSDLRIITIILKTLLGYCPREVLKSWKVLGRVLYTRQKCGQCLEVILLGFLRTRACL